MSRTTELGGRGIVAMSSSGAPLARQRVMRLGCVLLLPLLACVQVTVAPRQGAPAPRPATGVSALQRSMRRSYDEVRALEIALLFRRVEEVRSHAQALAALAPDTHLRGGSLRSVHARAKQIAAAPDAEATLPIFADLVVGCGSCHEEMRRNVRLQGTPEPADDGTLDSRMRRHQWASERMFDGLIVPSHSSWRKGLEELARVPLSPAEMSDDREIQPQIQRFGEKLAELAFEAASDPSDVSGRSYFYVRVLDNCVGCHAVAVR